MRAMVFLRPSYALKYFVQSGQILLCYFLGNAIEFTVCQEKSYAQIRPYVVP